MNIQQIPDQKYCLELPILLRTAFIHEQYCFELPLFMTITALAVTFQCSMS